MSDELRRTWWWFCILVDRRNWVTCPVRNACWLERRWLVLRLGVRGVWRRWTWTREDWRRWLLRNLCR